MNTEPHDAPAAGAKSGLHNFGPGLFLLAFAGSFIWLATATWRKWPSLVVDYGLQLYLPWQLSTGKVLYRDVLYLTGGPLSQYFHAVLFKCFGVSFTTLIITNLCLLAAFFAVLYRTFLRATDQFTAALICLVVLFTFAFSQNGSAGNYTYICPYAYETSHGLFLSVAAIACLWRWLATHRRLPAVLAGCFWGCVFLTKPELFLALTASLVAALFVRRASLPSPIAPRPPSPLLLLPGLLLPSLSFLAYFTITWNFTDGLKAVANSWVPLFSTGAVHNPFYAWGMGLDAPATLLVGMVYYTVCAGLGVALLAICARHCNRGGVSAIVVCLLLAFALYRTWNPAGWLAFGQALLPLTLFGMIFLGRRWWRQRHLPAAARYVFPLLWSVFALVLLAKLGLFTRIWHYGFYLAMPATAFVVLLIVWLLPQELQRFHVDPGTFRILALLFLVSGEVQIVRMSNAIYADKVYPVSRGGDRIYAVAPPQNLVNGAIQQTLAWLDHNTTPTNTLAVLPEGAMVNYLSRRTNPTPYPFFCLPEVLQAYGESNVVKSFASHRPDYILLIHRDPTEFGVACFGLEPGYGYDLMHWVRSNYSTIWLMGQEPLLKTNQYGLMMLKRNGLP